mgnify:FL=1
MSNKLSILDNGQMSKTFRYNINGKQVLETLDLDIQNGNFAKTKDIFFINPAEGRTKKLPIDPNSEFGKAVLADESGARQTSFLNTMDAISTKAGNQIVLNSSVYEDALRESGMYNKSRGFESHIGSTFPNTGENVDNTVEDDNKNDDIQPKEKKRSPTSIGHYTYPKSPEMHLDQDYMFIEKFKYNPPQSNYVNKSKRGRGKDWGGWALDRIFTDPFGGPKVFEKPQIASVNDESATNVFNKGLGKGSNIGKELLGSAKLPIPNGLSVSQGVNWGEGKVNAVEAGAFLGVQNEFSQLIAGKKNLAGVFGAGLDGMKNGLSQLKDAGQGGSNTLLSSLLAKNTLAQIGINVDPAQMIARSTGTAINPNLELLFSGPKLRTFKFVFNFAPNDDIDAKEVRKIMRMFREGMMPHGGTSDDRLFLGAPDVFRLSYKNKSRRIKSLNIFKICALTSCGINFTPDNQYQSYEDEYAISMPVRSTMELTFTELSPIFSNDYIAGDKDNASVDDLGMLVTGENEINENDIGF